MFNLQDTPTLLCIDCSTSAAIVAICAGDKVLAERRQTEQKEHAAFLHVAIDELFTATGTTPFSIDAVVVTSGPGSYTGLRVGLSTAKGICYAANKPLITLNTLKVMAQAALQQVPTASLKDADRWLICPMIDARRMEVFAGLYNNRLEPLLPPQPIILENDSFAQWNDYTIFYCGDGSSKFATLTNGSAGTFLNASIGADELRILGLAAYRQQQFADVAYAEPLYLKDFYTINKPANVV